MSDPVAKAFQTLATDTPDSIRTSARALGACLDSSGDLLPLAAGDFAGPYEIVSVLGSGGQAIVYEAVHRTLARHVALKIPRKEIGERIVREARLLADLAHPSIVSVIDVSPDGPLPYLVLELCKGKNLDERLEAAPDGLPLEDVRLVSRAMLEALGFAHERGILHRDVKPSNVLFTAEGEVKVSDFGIGTIARADELSYSGEMSQLSLLAGTPLYMAPEQENPAMRPGGKLDGRADLFSFGKVLFQMLTGANPRTIRPVSRLRFGLDPAWDQYVFRLTEEKPEKRFPSAKAALEAFPLKADDSLPSKMAAGVLPSRIGDYKIVRHLGDGGMGVVLEGEHVSTAQRVAIKVLHPNLISSDGARARFVRESQILARLDHTVIAKLYTVYESPLFAIVMELVEGENLRVILDRGPAAPFLILSVVSKLLDALAYAHAQGIVHREIEPENIVCNKMFSPKLVDFGTASLVGASKCTHSGTTRGSMTYMSKEQLLGKPLDARADIYSLGIVLYEAMTGRLPFTGADDKELVKAIAKAPPISPSAHGRWMPPELERIILKAIARMPEDRYASALAMKADVDRFLSAATADEKAVDARWTAPIVRKAVREAGEKVESSRFSLLVNVSIHGGIFGVGALATVLTLSGSSEPSLAPAFALASLAGLIRGGSEKRVAWIWSTFFLVLGVFVSLWPFTEAHVLEQHLRGSLTFGLLSIVASLAIEGVSRSPRHKKALLNAALRMGAPDLPGETRGTAEKLAMSGANVIGGVGLGMSALIALATLVEHDHRAGLTAVAASWAVASLAGLIRGGRLRSPLRVFSTFGLFLGLPLFAGGVFVESSPSTVAGLVSLLLGTFLEALPALLRRLGLKQGSEARKPFLLGAVLFLLMAAGALVVMFLSVPAHVAPGPVPPPFDSIRGRAVVPVDTDLRITTTSPLVPGRVGHFYYTELTAAGGADGAYVWSVTGLPPGIGVDSSNGVISGTTAASGVFHLEASVLSGGSRSRSYTFTIEIE